MSLGYRIFFYIIRLNLYLIFFVYNKNKDKLFWEEYLKKIVIVMLIIVFSGIIF